MELTEIIDIAKKESATNALPELENYLKKHPSSDEAYYLKGRLMWQIGKTGEAITAFEHAISINPNNEARHALEMLTDIIGYFNPDLMNP